MGGKGSGGLRVGAGRKSKEEHEHWLGGNAGRRHPGAKKRSRPAVEAFGPPSGLGEAVIRLWSRLAPHAFQARTLTRGTEMAFLDLLHAIVARDSMFATIERDGLTYLKVTIDGAGQEHSEVKVHPLISQHRGMMQRVETGMAKFRLSPIGKPMAEDVPTPEDPFDEFETIN